MPAKDDARPPKQCADCGEALASRRLTYCPEDGERRRAERVSRKNAAYYDTQRALARAAVEPDLTEGGAVVVPPLLAARLARAARLLADALREDDQAQRGEGWREHDPDGVYRKRAALIALRDAAREARDALRSAVPPDHE